VAVAEAYTSAFPDLVLEIDHQWAPKPGVAVLEGTVRGTQEADFDGIPATGKRIEFVYCNVLETEGDKIVREREYIDSRALMERLVVIGT